MSNRVTKLVVAGCVAALSLSVLGCEKKEDPLKKAGDNMQKAGEAAKKAGEELKK